MSKLVILFFIMVIVLYGTLKRRTQRPIASGIWFNDLQSACELTSEDADNLLDYLRIGIVSDHQPDIVLTDSIKSDQNPRIIFASIYDSNDNKTIFMGRGEGIISAIHHIISQSKQQKFAPQSVSIDIVDNVTMEGDVNVVEPLNIDRENEGIAFPLETNIAFLPEEIVDHKLIDSEGMIRYYKITKYLLPDSKKVAWFSKHFDNDCFPYYRFRTRRFSKA